MISPPIRLTWTIRRATRGLRDRLVQVFIAADMPAVPAPAHVAAYPRQSGAKAVRILLRDAARSADRAGE